MTQLKDSGQSRKPDLSFANEISTAALVRLLVSRGVLNIEELVAEEKKLRAFSSGKIPSGHKTSKLRQMAARYRWSRRLTSLLFGWKWYKKSNRKKKKLSFE